MSIEVIKNMKAEIEALKKDLDSAKSTAEIVKAIEARIDEIEAQRKKTFDVASADEATVKKVAKKAADLALKAKLLGRDYKAFTEFKEVAPIIEKAITPSSIENWIDEQFSKQIIDLMEYDLEIEKLFGSVVVPEGVGRLSFPQKTGRSKAYLIQPAQDAVESAITGGKVTFDPVKLKTLVIVSEEARNEAIVGALLDVVKQDMAYSLAMGIEDALINGDKSGDINNNPAATDVKNAFDALRKYGLANTVDNGGGSITIANIRKAVKQMGIYGVRPTECVIIVNPRVYSQIKDIPEIQTIDKIGNSAVLKTGIVDMIDGMKIIVSDFIPNNLNAEGKVDGEATSTKTAALVVNTKAFKVGKRNVVEFERDKSIINDTLIFTSRTYRDFKKIAVEDTAIAEIVNIGD